MCYLEFMKIELLSSLDPRSCGFFKQYYMAKKKTVSRNWGTMRKNTEGNTAHSIRRR